MLPDFWQDTENAAKIQQEISGIKEEIQDLEVIKKDLEDLKVLQDEELKVELEKKIEKQEF